MFETSGSVSRVEIQDNCSELRYVEIGASRSSVPSWHNLMTASAVMGLEILQAWKSVSLLYAGEVTVLWVGDEGRLGDPRIWAVMEPWSRTATEITGVPMAIKASSMDLCSGDWALIMSSRCSKTMDCVSALDMLGCCALTECWGQKILRFWTGIY